MEVCKNGDLEHFIKMYGMDHKGGEKYSTLKKMRMLKEVASAMKYLHSLNVIHRDLKPGNVLVTANEETRVMDFGLSKLAMSTGITQTMRVGTSVYTAPEVLTGHYDEKVDVFSFGILMYVLLTEKWMPYGEENSVNGVEMMWDHDTIVRPSFEDILLCDNNLKNSKTFMAFQVGDHGDGKKAIWVGSVEMSCFPGQFSIWGH